MTFQFTEDQLSIREMIRTYSEKEIRLRADEIDKTGRFPKENMDGLRELGILQLTIPEEYGGTGIDDEITKALAVMEVAKCCACTAEILDVHYLSTDIIMRKGTFEQKALYLPQAAEGKLGGFALTEPGAGSDAGGLKTKAEKDGDDYILNGTKCFISNLGPEEGSHFVVVAVTEPGIGTKGTTAFLVDRSMPGVSCGKTEDKMGIRGAAVSELVLEDVRVPSSAILGKLGEGFKIAMMGLDGGRIGIASQACTTAAAMAKWYASEAACYCCDLALQVHGGYGYMKDYPIERMYRDARILRIYEGTSEVQKMVVARAVMKG